MSAIAAAGLIAAACTGSDETVDTTTVVPPTTLAPAPRIDDGVLRLGVLLPTDTPLVADAIRGTSERITDEINRAGGVLGDDLELVIADEGASTTEITEAITGLIDADVDAIVGPIASTNAVSAIDIASSAGIATCSPTASAAILDDVPDDMLFFRTIASDTAQAEAIAETVDNTGARSVSIAHVDDEFGRPYASSVDDALDRRSLQVVSTVGFSPRDDLSEIVPTIVDDGADVLVVLAASAELASFVSVVGAAAPVAFDSVITNDPIRAAANQAVIAELPSVLRARMIGVAPQITDRRTDADTSAFGPQVTDCITLLALAAVQAGSDDPRAIAAQMAAVSSGGRLCRSFEACATQIEADRQIDYNGPTGLTELNRTGETTRAWFERFTFDDDGADEFSDQGRLQVTI